MNRSDGDDKWDPIVTVCVLFYTYDDRSFRASPDKPKYEESLDKRMLWSMVLKAAARSRRTKAKMFLLSMDKRKSFWIRSRAVSVEWKGLYADWNGDNDSSSSGTMGAGHTASMPAS